MNDNQFKSLDELMKNNPPHTDRALAPLPLPKSGPVYLWKAFAIGATALIVIAVVQTAKYNSKLDSLLALNETMSWDATSEEWPVGVEEDMEYLELPF
jgi:hypothetical protein